MTENRKVLLRRLGSTAARVTARSEVASSPPAMKRRYISATGTPNLWIPKHVQRVEAIPVLASGKLDLKKSQECAAEK